ncbi:MAG: stage II sporulation protein M [Capnocytophaga sp.]|nr:stage II sporulation protein M [Capnocytophaga sp.]
MNKKIIVLSLITYITGFVVSFYLNIGLVDSNNIKTIQFIEELQQMQNYDLWLRILKNNIYVITFNILGGFSFGLLTFVNTAYNGFILGYLMKKLLINFENKFIFNHLTPHLIEVIAIVLSCYLGYKTSLYIFQYLFKKKNMKISKFDYFICIICYLVIFISSILEAYVSTIQ